MRGRAGAGFGPQPPWRSALRESRAWATVNKESGGGNKSGSGRGKKDSTASSSKGGSKGGSTSSSRSVAARKGWETRRKRGNA